MITEVRGNARISFKKITKTGDVFYTFEYGETHSIEDSIEKTRELLWNNVNNEINKQIIEVKNLYKSQ